MGEFNLQSDLRPRGDQPRAIAELSEGVPRGRRESRIPEARADGQQSPDEQGSLQGKEPPQHCRIEQRRREPRQAGRREDAEQQADEDEDRQPEHRRALSTPSCQVTEAREGGVQDGRREPAASTRLLGRSVRRL